jgi:hypothetical protein
VAVADPDQARPRQVHRLREVHEGVSVAAGGGREDFSLTGMMIDWGAGLTTLQWDKQYRDLCGRADELRMLATRFGSEAAQAVEELYAQMNVYWGNYRGFLYRLEQGDAVGSPSPAYQKTHEAAERIGNLAATAKVALEVKLSV